ncbi:PaaI family thioesterase [Pararhodobacter marinus]|uniref:PaaI family thioesterase n=1 Tax=Pararhodobacter marinus TaxID=2184063 RepID=A0A2U2CHU5_9RHOB|nr:PaaI family thioesterase [Pararhodobacter marinus]PWE31465.1 PaaI family thioesterase [Pararhodobacter marinus]
MTLLPDMQAAGWQTATLAPFMQVAGPVWRRKAGDWHEYALLPGAGHANRRGITHGGVLMCFADCALGNAVTERTGRPAQVTAQLDVQFMAAAPLGRLLVMRPECVHRTRSTFFMRGVIFDGETPLVAANGIWKAVAPPAEERR